MAGLLQQNAAVLAYIVFVPYKINQLSCLIIFKGNIQMMNAVFFSVVIPSYNSSKFIEKALISVCEQTYRHFEIIVSDDESKDDTIATVKSVLQRYDVDYQILENSHQGAGGTRNTGISKAKHEWIAFLDSDDYWASDKLEQVKNVIERDHSVKYIFHNEIYINGDMESPIDYVGLYDVHVHPFLALVRNNFLSPTCAVIHKSLFEQTGGFDVSLLSAQDYDLWLKMSLLPEFKLYGLGQYLGYYVLRSGSITSNVSLRLKSLLRIYDRYYCDIKRISPKPIRELLRFKGRIYSGCGLSFLKQRKYGLGIGYALLGQCYWIRTDWIRKLLKK